MGSRVSTSVSQKVAHANVEGRSRAALFGQSKACAPQGRQLVKEMDVFVTTVLLWKTAANKANHLKRQRKYKLAYISYVLS